MINKGGTAFIRPLQGIHSLQGAFCIHKKPADAHAKTKVDAATRRFGGARVRKRTLNKMRL